MRKAGGELSGRGEPLRFPEPVDVLLQFVVNAFELPRGSFELDPLSPLAIAEESRDDAREAEDRELGRLIERVYRQRFPGIQNVRPLQEKREQHGGRGPPPPEEHTGGNERNEIQMVQKVVCLYIADGHNPEQKCEQTDAGGEQNRNQTSGDRLDGGRGGTDAQIGHSLFAMQFTAQLVVLMYLHHLPRSTAFEECSK